MTDRPRHEFDDPYVTTRSLGGTSMLLDRLRVRTAAARAALCGVSMGVLCAMPALGQSPPVPAPAASAAASELSPAERARRDADKVFRLIMIHSDKPRRAAASRDDALVATTRAKAPARPSSNGDEVTVKAGAAFAPKEAVVAVVVDRPSEAPVPDAAPVAADRPEPAAIVPVAAAATTPPAVPAPTGSDVETVTPLVRTEPQFAPNLMRMLRKGQVDVQFTVLPDGSVSDARVVTSSHPRLNGPALASIAQWRFAPVRTAQSAIVGLGFDLD
jgi:TonB family protein